MVSFKKLVFATSLLLSGVAAAPASAGTLNVAAAEVRAVNDFAIESRDLNKKDTSDASVAPPRPPPVRKCRISKRNPDEFPEADHANNILQDTWAGVKKISDNGHKATVTDLSGCTALFFYMGATLRRAAHIWCPNVPKLAEKAARDAGGSTSVTIGAVSQKEYDIAEKAVKLGNPRLVINKPGHIYSMSKVTDKVAVTLTGKDGVLTLEEGTGPRICRQPQ